MDPEIILNSNHGFLHIAARKGNTEMLNYLIERGAPLNSQNKLNQTPLFMAVYSNNFTAV